MEKYATAKKAGKPAVIHLDYPIYADTNLTGSCRRNMESQVEALLKEKDIQKMRDSDKLKVMRTETEMNSLRGMDIS